MEIIVQKYGGTSVSNQILREKIAKKVINLKNKGKKVVVVVSAIGRKYDPYATDSLIDFYNKANKEINSRELDMIMSCGEIISTTVLVNSIRKLGSNAVALTGFQAGVITNNVYGNATILRIEENKILKYLEKFDIAVIAGFQGISEEGEITTLGRGGSDNSAAAIGVALGAKEIEIYTDANGIMTADPRKVKSAKVLKSLNYDEVYRMALDGAKVIDYKAIETIKESDSILKVKKFPEEAKGSIISKSFIRKSGIITAVIDKSNLVRYSLVVNTESIKHNILMFISERYSNREFLTISDTEVNITIKKEKSIEFEKTLIDRKIEFSKNQNCTKLSIVAKDIHLVDGIIKKTIMILIKNNIEFLEISDSYLTIACLIKDSQLKKAINILHNEFRF